MDRKHDGHVWYKVKMTNINNDFNFNFWRTCCLGHFQCQNHAYNFFFLNKCRNKMVWNGNIVHKLQRDHFTLDLPFCRSYNIAPFCVKLCLIHMYYVIHKQDNLIWTTIHLDSHDHPMVEGHSKEVFEQIKSLVKEEAFCTPRIIVSTIALAINKTFIS
jgi:hypothetical protein